MSSSDPAVLRRLLRDVTALQSLPALWDGREPGYIAGGLLDVLVNLLQLDYAYVRFDNLPAGTVLEDWRPQGSRVPEALEASISIVPYPNLMDTSVLVEQSPGSKARIARIFADFPGERGMVLVGADRPNFPTEFEEHLLRVAVNQGTIALHNAHLSASASTEGSTTLPHLVGRERDEHRLNELLANTIDGHGSLVLVGGEAGIGKTAVVERLCQSAAEQHVVVVRGHCYALSDAPAYGPWLEIADQFRTLQQQTPALQSVPFPDPNHSIEQSDLFNQIHRFLSTAAREQPIVAVVDNVQWADPSSLELLRFLAHSVGRNPILILVTYRTDELTADHPLFRLLPFLVQEARTERIDLRPLSAADIHALLTRVYQLEAGDARRLAADLHWRTDGNPFFLTELLRTMEDESILTCSRDGIWHVGDVDQAPVPMLLRQVIAGHLSGMGDQASNLLKIAAVIGQEIPLAVWCAVAMTDEETLLSLLEHARLERLLRVSETGDAATFRHSLIREALYEDIPPWRRRRLHRAVAEELMSHEQPDLVSVAHHLLTAGDHRAADWLILAGERAERLLALRTARKRFEAAIELLDTQVADSGTRGWVRLSIACVCRVESPDVAARSLNAAILLAREAGDARLAARAQTFRGLMHCTTGALRQGLVEWEAAADALDSLEALPAESRWRYRDDAVASLTGRGHLSGYLALSGKFAAVRAHAKHYQNGIAQSGSSEQSTSTDIHAWGLALVAAFEGDPDGARRNFEGVRASDEGFGSHFTSAMAIDPELWFVLRPYLTDVRTAWDVAVSRIEESRRRGLAVGALDDHREPADSWRLPIISMGGSWDEALRLANQMLGSDSWSSRFHAQWCIGAIAREQGNRELAWQMIHAAWPIGLSEEPGNQMIACTIPMLRLATSLALDQADLSTARDWLQAHDRWLVWMGATLGQSESHGLWARLERLAGNLEESVRHAHEAVARASNPRQPLALLAAHRCLGAFETQAARYDAAEESLERSLRIADACDMPYERALTLLDYAALWRATQNAERFSQAIADVRAVCQPLGATRALHRAEQLSASLAIVPSGSRQIPAGLSSREVEVLRILAAGLTNREIAAQLYVSPYTVKRHVSNILTKIDVTTRAAAARFAADHGLT